MHRRVYSVYLTSKPSDAALAVEVGGPASPGAVWAFDDAMSVLNLQLHVLGVYVSLAVAAGEKPGRRYLSLSLLVSSWSVGGLLLPPAWAVVVDVGNAGLHGVQRVIISVLLLDLVVDRVEFQHALELFRRRGHSLSKQRLLHYGDGGSVGIAVVYTDDGRYVRSDA